MCFLFPKYLELLFCSFIDLIGRHLQDTSSYFSIQDQQSEILFFRNKTKLDVYAKNVKQKEYYLIL